MIKDTNTRLISVESICQKIYLNIDVLLHVVFAVRLAHHIHLIKIFFNVMSREAYRARHYIIRIVWVFDPASY